VHKLVVDEGFHALHRVDSLLVRRRCVPAGTEGPAAQLAVPVETRPVAAAAPQRLSPRHGDDVLSRLVSVLATTEHVSFDTALKRETGCARRRIRLCATPDMKRPI
jgi:hypothetical protein